MIIIQTFAYRWRKPSDDADVVVDCRVLRNPYRNRRIRYLDGASEDVRQEVMRSPGFFRFFDYNLERIDKLAKVKQLILVEIGCFGGKHRSVVVGEMMAATLKQRYEVDLEHTCQRR